MSNEKKSFIAYCDWLATFDVLPNEIAGKLVKHLFRFVNDNNYTCDDVVVNAIFANIKNTIILELLEVCSKKAVG